MSDLLTHDEIEHRIDRQEQKFEELLRQQEARQQAPPGKRGFCSRVLSVIKKKKG